MVNLESPSGYDQGNPEASAILVQGRPIFTPLNVVLLCETDLITEVVNIVRIDR
jgi:hypothetical protein